MGHGLLLKFSQRFSFWWLDAVVHISTEKDLETEFLSA